jgi:hypothetical protein
MDATRPCSKHKARVMPLKVAEPMPVTQGLALACAARLRLAFASIDASECELF